MALLEVNILDTPPKQWLIAILVVIVGTFIYLRSKAFVNRRQSNGSFF